MTEKVGEVQAVNFNCPGQVVIAGATKAVDKASEALKAAGAKRAIPLPVSAPFHSTLMKPAAERLKEVLDKIEFRDAKFPVFSNVTAEPVVKAEEIRALATESSKSAGEIKKLVDGINAQTDSSVGSVDMAQNIVDEQFELVNSSIKIFDQMKASMDSLTEELMNIDKAASEADQRRVEAVSAVDDISVIINDSASNANTVIEALNVLKKNVDNLDKTAAKLGENMDELKNEVRVFQI